MADLLLTAVIGLGAGVLSGMFGVGGGLLTTPAIRLILGAPALIAVGTPLLVIIPTAVVGAFSYLRRDSADLRIGLTIGAWGAAASIGGAYLSDLAGGTFVMLATAGLIAYMAVDTFYSALRPSDPEKAIFSEHYGHRALALIVLGVTTGLYSGFLGLGGGFVLVPMLSRFFGMPIKRAIGTSLVAIAVLAIPGSVAHWALGHVDVMLALGLMIGVVPGALLGARFTAVSNEKAIKIGFACLLLCAGGGLVVSELGGLAS